MFPRQLLAKTSLWKLRFHLALQGFNSVSNENLIIFAEQNKNGAFTDEVWNSMLGLTLEHRHSDSIPSATAEVEYSYPGHWKGILANKTAVLLSGERGRATEVFTNPASTTQFNVTRTTLLAELQNIWAPEWFWCWMGMISSWISNKC